MNKIPMHFSQSFELLSIEIFFTLIIIFSSLVIFYKTKDLYKLSNHRGIHFFRLGFFFIGISHIISLGILLFRTFLIKYFSFSSIIYLFRINDLFFLIGIIFLFSSMYSKKIKSHYIYLVAFGIFLLTLIINSRLLFFFFTSISVILLGCISIYKLKTTKKKSFSSIYLIYMLIFISWLLALLSNILDIFPRGKTINVITLGCALLYILIIVERKLVK